MKLPRINGAAAALSLAAGSVTGALALEQHIEAERAKVYSDLLGQQISYWDSQVDSAEQRRNISLGIMAFNLTMAATNGAIFVSSRRTESEPGSPPVHQQIG